MFRQERDLVHSQVFISGRLSVPNSCLGGVCEGRNLACSEERELYGIFSQGRGAEGTGGGGGGL